MAKTRRTMQAVKKRATSRSVNRAHKSYEKTIRVRPLVRGDYDELVELQLKCFPGMQPWAVEQFESMLARFPEGQLAVELDGRLVASSSSLILDFDRYSDWQDWKAISDSGYIRNHDPNGDTLYGIEMMVHPDHRGMRLSRRLYEARKELAREKNLTRIVVGGRIPGYKRWQHELSAQEYVEMVIGKSRYDPTLTPQIANGFVLRGIIPDYMPSDEDSAGYATFLEWLNPAYVPKAGRHYRVVQSVSVCAVQYQMRTITSFDEFAQQCEFFVDVASDYRQDFIVFPELLTLQLLSFLPPTERPGQAARKLAELTPQYLDLFSRLAVRYNINIIGGSQFTLDGINLFNSAYLFGRDGTLGRQDKIHITPSERKWWGVAPGHGLRVFDTDLGRVAILICYDIEFPELARLAAAQGAMIVFCPFNTDERNGYLRVRICAQARCIENHLYVVTAGCVGNLPQVANADIHYAQSGIFTPADLPFSRDGIAAECTPNIETLVLQTLDLELLRQHRYSGVTRNWGDRRKDLYKVVFTDGETTIEV